MTHTFPNHLVSLIPQHIGVVDGLVLLHGGDVQVLADPVQLLVGVVSIEEVGHLLSCRLYVLQDGKFMFQNVFLET